MLLCAALAGCTAAPPAGEAPRAGAATEQPAGTTERAGETAALTPHPEPMPEVNANPDRLKGLDHAGLAAILGQPSFQRVDGPAALLRYRDTSCMLDLFLYAPPKGDRETARVNHIEARDVEGAPMTPGDCFAVLLRARQKHAG